MFDADFVQLQGHPTALAKQVHKFTHPSNSDLAAMLVRSKCDRRTTPSVCSEVLRSCTVCAESRITKASQNISFENVCEDFNENIQAAFTFITTRTTK